MLLDNLYKKFYVFDAQNEGCSEAEQADLLETFEYAMKRSSIVPASALTFELKHLVPRRPDLHQFTLMLDRHLVCGQHQWWGKFKCAEENKTLHVMGGMEEKSDE